MNKKKGNKIWRYVYILLILILGLAIYLSVKAILNIPSEYNNQQNELAVSFKQMIQDSLDNNDMENLNAIDNEYPIEFVIYDSSDSSLIFSTLPEIDVVKLKGALNKNAVALEDFFSYTTKEKTYDIWMLQYYISPQKVVNTWMMRIIAVVFLIVAINVLAMSVLYIKFLKPINRLRENVAKISKYQLDLASVNKASEYDQISSELIEFAQNLQINIQNTEFTYTELEKKLQLQNEKLEYQNRMVAALTHDLKAPLTNIILRLEYIKKSDYDYRRLLDDHKLIDYQAHKLIADINDIAIVAYQDDFSTLQKVERFNIIELLMEIYDVFIPQFREKDYIVETNLDERIDIEYVKLYMKQVIYNAFSNIANYGKAGGEVVISCYNENDYLYLGFYNDGDNLSEEQLNNIFNLFYRISTNQKGLGTGLYTIKNLVDELNGEVRISNRENGIILELLFKI
ncbi:HAMP domain-containing histidine kinase [Erysipelotrichaceae bacterium OttesenSCG-928-M19]|nr:HAMP domain-containing histidine kinase [Erysipelotrichaceae bacterium OttesenSCG-928-M19]